MRQSVAFLALFFVVDVMNDGDRFGWGQTLLFFKAKILRHVGGYKVV